MKCNETELGIYLSNFFNLCDQRQRNPYYCWLRREKLKKGLFSTYLCFRFASYSSNNKQTNGSEKSWKMFTKQSIDAMKFLPKRIEFPQISNKSYDVVVIIVLIMLYFINYMFCVWILWCCFHLFFVCWI